MATAANMCKKLPSDAADFVMEAVPLLTNLLQYHDAKVIYECTLFGYNLVVVNLGLRSQLLQFFFVF